jgi:SAM-dependent methyltransferase
LDYEDEAAKRTEALYKKSGIQASIHHRDFFETTPFPLYDVLTSFGVFEHFENLPASIAQTRHYLRPNGTIVTVIPNMNGLVGWLQKSFNRAVYDIHIPYRKEDLLQAHEKAGYTTLFCDYFGTYQGGVVNLSGHPREKVWQKILAAPGKPMHLLETILGKRLDGVFHSPYVIYIGTLGE